MDTEKLTTLITGMTVEESVQFLNEPVTRRQHVPVEKVKAWACKQMSPDSEPLMWKLKKISSDDDHPGGGLAHVILEAIGLNMPPWNMDAPENQALMQQAVVAGLLTQDQITELVALADFLVPRWQAEGLGPVRQWKISEVLS